MQNIDNIRHSMAHLLAGAVKAIYPDAKNTIGPAVDNGFYYDFEFSSPISDKDFKKIENKMREIVKKWDKFEQKFISASEAKEMFKDNPYKLELIEGIEKTGEKISIYTSGDFTDLCSGPHVDNAKELPLDGFKISKLAGAYWRGDENNKQLTRIYGLSFLSKEDLENYEKMMVEAEKRDHRKLGKELDLFHMDDKVGLGLPLWHPKGALLWRVMEDFWYREHLKNGYELVRTPHIGNRALWEQSGHWGFYNSSMYPPIEVGQTLEEKQKGEKVKLSEEFLLKPMNCPFHVQIYKDKPKSYRQFPFRWAECGTVYRFEKKGQLSGLTRVRGFTQDDAHIVCRQDQVEDELKRVIDFIMFMYKSFGFDPKTVKVFLSLRDPENKEKYTGNDKGWEFTESVLRKVAMEKGLDFTEEKGEAAFYGPKLDFKIKDVLGRLWQCSTLQFDFNLPERFDMDFTNSAGEKERPYMLHRALFGSFERFIGLLIENYGGNFPTWLAPVQVKVIPVRENHNSYAQKIVDSLRGVEVRVQFDDSDEGMGKKIRAGKNERVPYMLVIGDNEMADNMLTIESRDTGKQEKMLLAEFVSKISSEIKERK